MLLAIDIGNSNTVVGVFDDNNLINHFRVASNHDLTIDECGFFVTGLLQKLNIEPSQLDRAVIASVVPRLTPVYESMSRKYLSITPLIVSSRIRLPIKIAYDDPTAVGADRIANATAAFVKHGGPIIVVDFGTATTFDVINRDGVYLGGVIAPGVETSGAELARRAARLFEVRIERPDKIIGSNTAESIKSGLFYGTVGLVDSVVELILKELADSARVIATGGLAEAFAAGSRFIESCEPALTLEGLKIIADHQDSE
jgi:type III pantothenate kinase